MITANEAKANVEKFRKEWHEAIRQKTLEWVEDVVSPEVIEASKQGKTETGYLYPGDDDINTLAASMLSSEPYNYQVEEYPGYLVVKW